MVLSPVSTLKEVIMNKIATVSVRRNKRGPLAKKGPFIVSFEAGDKDVWQVAKEFADMALSEGNEWIFEEYFSGVSNTYLIADVSVGGKTVSIEVDSREAGYYKYWRDEAGHIFRRDKCHSSYGIDTIKKSLHDFEDGSAFVYNETCDGEFGKYVTPSQVIRGEVKPEFTDSTKRALGIPVEEKKHRFNYDGGDCGWGDGMSYPDD